MRFSVLVEFFGGFCSCGWFFSMALRFLIDPLILLYSGVLHRFLLYKLKKSLFLKLHVSPFVLFHVLNYSRPCIVISSEIVWEILLIFFILNFIFIFSGNKVLLSFSLHTWIWDWKWGECGFGWIFDLENYQFRCPTVIKESLFDLGCLPPAVSEILK